MKKALSLALVIISSAFMFAPLPAQGQGQASKGMIRRNEAAIPNRYIVILKDSIARGEVAAAASMLAHSHGGSLLYTYENAVKGFSVEMNEAAALALSRNPSVAYVEEDAEVYGAAIQNDAPWGLDRIDQRDLPLNTTYSYTNSGEGVNVYVIDSGIRFSHQEFSGRAALGVDLVADGQNGNDCYGHGTHVAAIIAGNTFGVAKAARLHSVRVLDCFNRGSLSRVIAGLDWVTANHAKPAVANLSFISTTASDALDASLRNSIAAGVTCVVSAGNNNIDAGTRSPSRVTEAITVAATDAADTRAVFSNYGSAVDLFAPGVDILSAWATDDAATSLRSGTSSAAPFVAGIAAMYLSRNPEASPDAVSKAITGDATGGKVIDAGAGSPNLLLYRPDETPLPSGETILLADDFNATSLDASKWSIEVLSGQQDTSISVNQASGQLNIGPLYQNTSGSHYNGVLSVGGYDLTGAYASVQVTQPPAASSTAYAMLTLPIDGPNHYRIFLEGDSLNFEKKISNTKTRLPGPTYDPINHAFWRIRHDAASDQILFETASRHSGAAPWAWVTHAAIARELPLTSVRMELKAGTSVAQTTQPGTVSFDNFKLAIPAPPETVLITDNFNATSLDTSKWSIEVLSGKQDTSISVNQASGQLNIGPLYQNTSGSHYNGVLSVGGYDLTGAYASVQVTQPPAASSTAYAMLTLPVDWANHYRIFLEGSSLNFEKKISNTKAVVGSLAYDPIEHAFWRIKHDAASDQVLFETASRDSGAAPWAWTTRAVAARELSLTSVRMELKAGTSVAQTTQPGTVSFDNFRAAKP